MARQVGSKLGLVVDLIPHHGVRLACGVGRPDREDESPLPGGDEQPQHLEGGARGGANGGEASKPHRQQSPSPRTLRLPCRIPHGHPVCSLPSLD